MLGGYLKQGHRGHTSAGRQFDNIKQGVLCRRALTMDNPRIMEIQKQTFYIVDVSGDNAVTAVSFDSH